MNVLSRLLAVGAFVALIPVGLVIARRALPHRRVDAMALAMPLAIAALSLPLLAAAVIGHFSPAWNGAAGWLVAALSLPLLRGPSVGHEMRNGVMKHAVVLCFLGFAAVIYSLAVVETPIGSRDEGLYTLAALALERAGSVVLTPMDPVAAASGLFAPFVSGIAFHLPGIPAASSLKPQFSPLLSTWIAQLHAAGGDRLLYRFNVFTVVVCGGVFYALLRRVVRPPFALLALAVFLLNPAQVWIARINLAEPLGALFALSGLLVGIGAIRSGDKAGRRVSATLLALAVVVRVDLIVMAPLLTLGAVALLVIRPGGRDAARLAAWGTSTLLAQAAALALLALWSTQYVLDHLAFLVLPPVAGIAGMAAYAGLRRFTRIHDVIARHRPRLAVLAVATLVLVFGYAALVRPFVEPFAIVADRGSALAGMRDYREESLSNLASYLGWPTVVLALVGAACVLGRTGRRHAHAPSIVACVLGVGAAVIYLAAPHVSPDHPWAIRRMTTLVIPLSILLAAVGLQALVRATGVRRLPRLVCYVVPVVAAWLLIAQRATLTFTENLGLTAQLRALDAALPAGPLVVRGFDGLATTFALGFGREVLPLRDESVAVDAAGRAFWQTCEARPCALVHASYEGLDGLVKSAPREFDVSREYVDPVVHPPAHGRRREHVRFLVTGVMGIERNPPPANAGAARDWRLDDRGLYRDELAPGGLARWTNGDAEMQLPARRAQHVELRLLSASTVPQPLRISLDGKLVYDGNLQPGEGRWTMPLSGAPDAHQLSIRSSTFIPGETVGSDRRSLGVSVRAVRLRDGDPRPLDRDSPASDFGSRLVVAPSMSAPSDDRRSTLSFRVDADNLGPATWLTERDARGASPHVALGMYWTQPADARRLLEHRIGLPYSLLPDEHWTTQVVVDLDSEPVRRLPPGSYELHLGLVLEGVAWFTDRGGRAATIPITIPAR